MARKIRTKADPTLAESHAAGAKVTLVQPALHETYGTLLVPRPVYWLQHAKAALARQESLRQLDQRVLETELGASDSRILAGDLAIALYVTGTEAVLHIVLAVQQLVTELELGLKITRPPLENLNTRLGTVLRAIEYMGLGVDPRYGRFGELQEVRDAVEHPEKETVYNSTGGEWDRVPLAWIASGKALSAIEASLALIADIAKAWDAFQSAHASGPGTLTGVTRGIRSLESAKKAPVR